MPTSTRDPARFAFAHGGNDGTRFRVDRETYDRTIETLNAALNIADVDRREPMAALSGCRAVSIKRDRLGHGCSVRCWLGRGTLVREELPNAGERGLDVGPFPLKLAPQVV